jgi:hypothetical protein
MEVSIQTLWTALVIGTVLLFLFDIIGYILLSTTSTYWSYGAWCLLLILIIAVFLGIIIWKGYVVLKHTGHSNAAHPPHERAPHHHGSQKDEDFLLP